MKKMQKGKMLKIVTAVALALGVTAGLIDPASAALAGGAMLSVSALSSQGVTLEVGDTGSPGPAYQVIPEINNMNGPSGSATVIDVSDLSSTAKEKAMGLMDEGQVTLDMNYIADNSVQEVLRLARANKTLKVFRITFTDSGNATFEFSGYVTTFQVTNAVDQVTKVSVTIEITGAITRTP